MDANRNFVITIGRQFGSGGRELGKLIAERFGIAYYDKELLLEAAAASGMSREIFELHDERMPSLLGRSVGFNMGSSMLPWYNGDAMLTDSVHTSLSDLLEHLASTRSCVIVGRSADWVLRSHPAPRVSLFVHAPMEARVERILRRSDKTRHNEARSLAEKTDKLRAQYYNFYTDKRWGDAASYDLTFDLSVLPLADICDILALYIRRRFGIEPVRKLSTPLGEAPHFG